MRTKRSVPALAPHGTSTGSARPSVGAAPPGKYYVLACADDTRTVAESFEANNCTASLTTVTIT